MEPRVEFVEKSPEACVDALLRYEISSVEAFLYVDGKCVPIQSAGASKTASSNMGTLFFDDNWDVASLPDTSKAKVVYSREKGALKPWGRKLRSLVSRSLVLFLSLIFE